MSTENMRLLMEAAAPLDEEFKTEPMSVDTFSEPYGDRFRDEEPAQPMTVVASVDIPAMYMNAGDEIYLKPTNNHGEAYSEENGLTYEWDFIFHLIRDRNMLEIKQVGDGVSTDIEYSDPDEEPFEEGIAGDAVKDVYRKATGRVTDKAGLERMVRIHVEQAITRLELGMQARNANDPEFLAEIMGKVREELIDLQKWIRNRNK